MRPSCAEYVYIRRGESQERVFFDRTIKNRHRRSKNLHAEFWNFRLGFIHHSHRNLLRTQIVQSTNRFAFYNETGFLRPRGTDLLSTIISSLPYLVRHRHFAALKVDDPYAAAPGSAPPARANQDCRTSSRPHHDWQKVGARHVQYCTN